MCEPCSTICLASVFGSLCVLGLGKYLQEKARTMIVICQHCQTKNKISGEQKKLLSKGAFYCGKCDKKLNFNPNSAEIKNLSEEYYQKKLREELIHQNIITKDKNGVIKEAEIPENNIEAPSLEHMLEEIKRKNIRYKTEKKQFDFKSLIDIDIFQIQREKIRNCSEKHFPIFAFFYPKNSPLIFSDCIKPINFSTTTINIDRCPETSNEILNKIRALYNSAIGYKDFSYAYNCFSYSIYFKNQCIRHIEIPDNLTKTKFVLKHHNTNLAVNAFKEAAITEILWILIKAQMAGIPVKEAQINSYIERAIPILSADKKDPQGYFELGKGYYEIEEFDEALNYFVIAQNFQAKMPEVYSFTGHIFCLKKDFENARIHCEKAIQMNPINPTVNEHMGLLEYAMNNYEEAIKYFKRALIQNDEKASLYINLCNCYIKTNQLPEAIKTGLKFKKINPDLLMCLGDAYYRNKEYKKASNYLKQAIENNINCLQVMLNLVQVYLELNDYEMAHYYAIKAVDFNPENIDARIMLGTVHVNSGDYTEAIDLFNTILVEKPDHKTALAKIGECYEMLDMPAKAIEYYDRLLSIYPSLTDYRKRLSKLKEGR
jgi:tetratricopeptide (TPR) repeat protein